MRNVYFTIDMRNTLSRRPLLLSRNTVEKEEVEAHYMLSIAPIKRLKMMKKMLQQRQRQRR
jgi:hypothetical protein